MSFENTQPETQKNTFESSEREELVFKNYLNHLGLSEENFLNAEVLDIGAGSRMFSAHLLREGLTDKISSLEPKVQDAFPEENEELKRTLSPEKMKALDERTVEAELEKMPYKDNAFNLIVGHGVVPGIEDRENVDGFDEIMRVLRSGGEARLYPLHKEEGSWSAWRKKVDEKLAIFSREGHEVRIEEASKYINQDGREVLLDRVIIKKMGNQK